MRIGLQDPHSSAVSHANTAAKETRKEIRIDAKSVVKNRGEFSHDSHGAKPSVPAPIPTTKASPIVIQDADVEHLVPIVQRLQPDVDAWRIAKLINPETYRFFPDIEEDIQQELIADAVAKSRVPIYRDEPTSPEAHHPIWQKFLMLASHFGVFESEVEAEFQPQDIADLCLEPEDKLPLHMKTLSAHIIANRTDAPIEHPADDTPEVPCGMCVHLLRSMINPEGGLAQCTLHLDLPLTAPSIRRRCNDFHLSQ